MSTDRELSKEFDWGRNRGVTVTRASPPPIAVYRNDTNEVVIRQQPAHPMDFDSIIVIDYRDVRRIVEAITASAALIVQDIVTKEGGHDGGR